MRNSRSTLPWRPPISRDRGFRRAGGLALWLLALAAPAAAQNTPEAAATAFGKALSAADWPGAARLMHPAAIRQLRELFSLALSNEKLSQAREQIFGFKSAAEAKEAPDTILFAAFLKNVLTRQQGFAEAMKTATVTPLGHIQPGDTAFVVTRLNFQVGGVSVTQFDIMPFVREGPVWKGALKSDFTNMAAMLRSLVAPVGG
jgi:hypothetical protein